MEKQTNKQNLPAVFKAHMRGDGEIFLNLVGELSELDQPVKGSRPAVAGAWHSYYRY